MPEDPAIAAAVIPAPYDPGYSLGRQLRRVVTQIVATIDRRMGPIGLTDAQWRPLLCLRHGSPPQPRSWRAAAGSTRAG